MAEQYLMLKISDDQLLKINRLIGSIGLEIVGTGPGRGETLQVKPPLYKNGTVTQLVRRQVQP